MDEVIERGKRDLQNNTPVDVEALFARLTNPSDCMAFAPLFQAAGDEKSAIRCYETAIAAAPALHAAYYLLAKIHAHARRHHPAIKVLRDGILACRLHSSAKDLDHLIRDYISLSCVESDADMVDWDRVLRQDPVPGRAIPDAIRVTMVKDEADIIYFSLRSTYLAGIRNYVIADNASRDATRSEIDRFAADHPDCTVLIVDDLILAYYQAEKTNALMHLGVSYFSMAGPPISWVFVVDGDEYFTFLNPDYDLKGILDAADAKQADMLVFMWSTAAPAHVYSDLPRQQDPRQVFSVISGFRYAGITKVAVRYSPGVYIEMGSHYAANCADDPARIMLMPEYGAMMMHSPMRSVAQAYKKILNGGKALQAAATLGPGQGGHWRTQFDAYKADGVAALRKNLLDFIAANKRHARWIKMRIG